MQSLTKILSSINDAVWSFDLFENKFIYVNNRLASIYETSLEVIQSNPSFWINYIHPEDYTYVLTETKQAYDGKSVDIEYRLVVNQKIKWVQDKKVVVFNDTGERKILTGILCDITEKKKTEISLSESELTFRYLFINNPNPLWIYDCTTLKFLVVNHAAISKYGYSKEEFLNMTIADIRPPDEIDDHKISIKKVKSKYFNSGKAWQHIKKNGEVIYVDISGHGITYHGVEAEIVMAHDITEQVESRRKITLAKENLDALINNIEDHIWSIDSNYAILSTNIAFQSFLTKVLGRNIQIGESIFIIADSDNDRDLWKKYYDRALKGDAFQFIELVNLPLIQPFFAETKLNPIYLNGEIIGVACISSNIQERLEAQKKIIEHNKKLLELVSIASHEIRGPVASLLGLVDIFNKNDYSDPFNAEVISHVQNTTQKLDDVLHTLVDKTFALQEEHAIKYSAQRNQSTSE